MVDVIKKSECDEKHKDLDEDIEKALAQTAKAVSAHIKVWLLGSLLGVLLAVSLNVLYTVQEMGQYKERVDTTRQQVDEWKANNGRQFEELKQELREMRNLLLGKGVGHDREP